MSDCAICLGKRKRNEVTTSMCKHAFHRKCLAQWSARNRDDCPLCRAPTVHDTIRKSLVQRMDDLETALGVLNEQLKSVSWPEIRFKFPSYRLANAMRSDGFPSFDHSVLTNPLLIIVLWIMLFQGPGTHKALKDAYIDALGAYKRLVVEVTNADLPVQMTTAVPRLEQLVGTYSAFKDSFPAWLIFDPPQPKVSNNVVYRPDTSFMKRIMKVVGLSQKKPMMYQEYMIYLREVRKFYKKKSMVR